MDELECKLVLLRNSGLWYEFQALWYEFDTRLSVKSFHNLFNSKLLSFSELSLQLHSLLSLVLSPASYLCISLPLHIIRILAFKLKVYNHTYFCISLSITLNIRLIIINRLINNIYINEYIRKLFIHPNSSVKFEKRHNINNTMLISISNITV